MVEPQHTGDAGLAALAAQLADGRDRLRADRAAFAAAAAAERAKLKAVRDRIAPLHRKARRDRKRARLLVGRFVAHFKKRWVAARQFADANLAEAAAVRRQADDLAAKVAADRAKLLAESDAQHRRLKDGWRLLADGQRRLAADRRRADADQAARAAALDAREADLAAREGTFEHRRAEAEGRIRDLLAEGDRLDLRVARNREALAGLDRRRAAVEADLTAAAAAGPSPGVVLTGLVPLDGRVEGGVDRLLADLDRDRKAVAAARADVDRRADQVADDRLVLAEQVAALAVARDHWQAAERHTLAELEAVTRAVQAREGYAAARERELAAAEARFQERWAELSAVRLRLDAWSAELTAREADGAAATARAEADLDARRAHLSRWEAALKALCRKWADARGRDKAAVEAAVAAWAALRADYTARLADLDRTRDRLLADAAAVASHVLAAEQAAGDGATAARRVRVLKRAWERHFDRARRDISTRRGALSADAAALDDRLAVARRAVADALSRQAAAAHAEQAAEADLTARERAVAEREAVLLAAAEGERRTTSALMAARNEVERVAAALLDADVADPRPSAALPAGVVALQPA